MSDLEALYIFLNKPVSSEMVHYLVATTTSIISVPKGDAETHSADCTDYPSPPQSPQNSGKSATHIPSLYEFIQRLIQHSHVQSTTLMTCLIYLNRLKQVIAANSVGMATTHHRIFLGAMLLAAKYTNDSSPMNKHWTAYTDGLLSLREVNALEIEMIQYIGWGNLRFENSDLIHCLSYFLEPIKRKLRTKKEEKLMNEVAVLKEKEAEAEAEANSRNYTYRHHNHQPSQSSTSSSYTRISHSSTSSSLPSLISASSSTSTVSSYMSLPRKDSVQSIESTTMYTTSCNTNPSPTILSNCNKDNAQRSSPKSDSLNSISMPLRPLKLKPKFQLSDSSSNINNQNDNSIANSRKFKNSTNIPISSSTSSSSLKNSKKSFRLVNLSQSNISEKENISSSASNIDNTITVVT